MSTEKYIFFLFEDTLLINYDVQCTHTQKIGFKRKCRFDFLAFLAGMEQCDILQPLENIKFSNMKNWKELQSKVQTETWVKTCFVKK